MTPRTPKPKDTAAKLFLRYLSNDLVCPFMKIFPHTGCTILHHHTDDLDLDPCTDFDIYHSPIVNILRRFTP